MRGQRHSEGEAVVDASMAMDKANGQRPKRASWMPDYQQLCQLAIGCNDVATLQALASKFFRTISADVETCLSRKKGPRATSRLCSLLKSFLIHLHTRPSQLKAFTRPQYENLVAALLSYYIDLCFEISNANASVAFLSQVVTTVNLTLGHSPRHIVETLLHLNKDPTEKWDELYPLLKKLLANPTFVTQSPRDFMMTIILLKQWLKYGSNKHHRRIRKLGASLGAPAGLNDWLVSHGFKHVSAGPKEPGVCVGEYLLSDQLTAKDCRRLLDIVCITDEASHLSPSSPSVAQAPKASEPPPCFFVLDTQPDRQTLMENEVPTGDNCEQLYRALDSTIEAMDLETGWRFGLGDGDGEDDGDLCPLQFHLENSIEHNGFDVTPPKKRKSSYSPEQGKLDVEVEVKGEAAIIADLPSKKVLSPRVIKSSDRSRRKSSISNKSAEGVPDSPEPASHSPSILGSGPGSNQKADINRRRSSGDFGCHSTKRAGRRKSYVLDAYEDVGLTAPEDVVRELFSSRHEVKGRRASNNSSLSKEASVSPVKEVLVSSPKCKNLGGKKLNLKVDDVLTESAIPASPSSRKGLATNQKSNDCKFFLRTVSSTESTAGSPSSQNKKVRRKSYPKKDISDNVCSPAQSPSCVKIALRNRCVDSSVVVSSPDKSGKKRSRGVTLRVSKKMRTSSSPLPMSDVSKSHSSDKAESTASTNSSFIRRQSCRKSQADSSGKTKPPSTRKSRQSIAHTSPSSKKANSQEDNGQSGASTPRNSVHTSAKQKFSVSPNKKLIASPRNVRSSNTPPQKKVDSSGEQKSGLEGRSVIGKRKTPEVVDKASSVPSRRSDKSAKQSPAATRTPSSGKVRRRNSSPPKVISNFSLRQKYRLRSRQSLKS